MEIVRREIYYAEPLPLTLISLRDLSGDEQENLKQFLEVWPEVKLRQESRPRSYAPRLRVDGVEQSRAVRVLSDWFPKEWFEPLAADLARQFPSFDRLEIGCDFEPPPHDDQAFIEVSGKTVLFEDGTRATVAPFAISKYPISIAQFAFFSEQTGYRSLAEQRGDEFTFRQGPSHGMIPPPKRGPLPAQFLCYHDALAYCTWAGRRLPTEAEWLAASLLAEAVIDSFKEQERYRERFVALAALPAALAVPGTELTATLVNNSLVVIRGGPYLIRSLHETQPRPHLRRVVRFEYREFLQFRVCK
jgi:hypothetical protein